MISSSMAKQIKTYEEEYKVFMGTDLFPNYGLQAKEVSLRVSEKQGFDSVAITDYLPESDSHRITVSTNITIPRYVIFHEFTHILDTELYAKGDKIKYALISGFTEYHASQIELIDLLNIDTINTPFSFSMTQQINTISGQKSVYHYLHSKLQHASDLFIRTDFPADLNTLKTAIGVLYNYFGLRSICEMYSVDFSDQEDYSVFLNYMSSTTFHLLKTFMKGWLTPSQIEFSGKLYYSIIAPLIDEYKLA